jgi:serine/threonine-protein phosphatase 6 regulatory ankyrin repeat subunit B
LLVSHGAIPVDRQSSARLKFVEAAAQRDIEGMEGAIKDGAQINATDAGKKTALTAALQLPIFEARDAMAIFWLLDHRADPNLKGDGKLPLNEFVFWGSTFLNGEKGPYLKQLAESTLAWLLKAGAKVSGTDEIGRTPLHVAAKYDRLRAAEILIEEGAKVMPRDKFGKTPLDYAESTAMIRLLKQNGATER